MGNLILVASGGAVGAVARYLAGVQIGRLSGSDWPVATLVVNVVGGLLMGVLVASLALQGAAEHERWRLLLGVGVLGGFTTFSAYSLEVAQMVERGRIADASAYALGSVILSVGALFAGLWIVRRLAA